MFKEQFEPIIIAFTVIFSTFKMFFTIGLGEFPLPNTNCNFKL
jgi:hypothetical protein